MRGWRGYKLPGAAAGDRGAGAGPLRAWAFVCDDAFISFRYARNLAEHGTLAFNLASRAS
jgi:hypothetical protein